METLRDLRIQSKKSPSEVAKALNVSIRAIYNYEYGIRQISLNQVISLSKLFEVSAEEIITAQLNSCQLNPTNSRR